MRLVVNVVAFEIVENIFVVRNFGKVERREQLFVNHPLNHVVGGDNDIVNRRSAADFRVHILVAGVGRIVDLHIFSEHFATVTLEFRVDVQRIL